MIKDHGSVKDSKFIIGERAYNLVVLPPYFENFEPYMYELIKKYLEKGGKVLSFAGIPVHLDGNISRKMPAFINNYEEQWLAEDTLDEDIIRQYFNEEDFKAINPGSWNGKIFHQRRQFQDGQLLFITNFDKENTGNFQFEITGQTALYLDPFTGNYKLYPAKVKENRLAIASNIEPGGSLLLYISNKNVTADKWANIDAEDKSSVNASETRIKQNKPNALTLDYCNLELNGENFNDLYFYNAQEKIFKFYLKDVYGFNYNPWSIAIQYRTRILDKNNFEKGSGFKADFPFQTEDGFMPSNMKVVVEWPQLYTVSCNGSQLEPIENEWWLDRSFGVFNISDFLKPGINVITVKADPMDILAELEPVYLTGDFGLTPIKNGWKITREDNLDLGSWKEQGLPFYSESITYSKTFENDKDKRNYMVKLNDWKGTVAEVLVNGETAGIIGWKPYELDISKWVKNGQNKVEVIVTGSLKNLLGPHHNNPSVGFVTPWIFFSAPDHQPPGSEYQQLDYGLFKDFEIQAF
jgi:hypothetical protein